MRLVIKGQLPKIKEKKRNSDLVVPLRKKAVARNRIRQKAEEIKVKIKEY